MERLSAFLLAFPWMREHLAEVCKLAAANNLKLLRESFHRWLLLGAAVDRCSRRGYRWQAWARKKRGGNANHTHTHTHPFELLSRGCESVPYAVSKAIQITAGSTAQESHQAAVYTSAIADAELSTRCQDANLPTRGIRPSSTSL